MWTCTLQFVYAEPSAKACRSLTLPRGNPRSRGLPLFLFGAVPAVPHPPPPGVITTILSPAQFEALAMSASPRKLCKEVGLTCAHLNGLLAPQVDDPRVFRRCLCEVAVICAAFLDP